MTHSLRSPFLCSNFIILALAFALSTSIYADGQEGSDFSKRPFDPAIGADWIGNGISYGAYRDGEGPDTHLTSKENILEDLLIMADRWRLIRVYGSDTQSENILSVIEAEKLPIKMMLGIWLDAHKSDAENKAQVDQAIELANRYSDIVVAINVGNEIFVDWSYHRIDDMGGVINEIRRVRESVPQPVTVSDDYNFWNKPHAKQITAEIDFICLHAYAFWNNIPLKQAMDWTVKTYNDISALHPEHTIAYCETGWPTSRIYNDGSYEGGLIGKAGLEEQKSFFKEYDEWVEQNRVISFYFSSFDEKWKGGFDGKHPMDKAEKHWGLYFSDRSPKPALSP